MKRSLAVVALLAAACATNPPTPSTLSWLADAQPSEDAHADLWPAGPGFRADANPDLLDSQRAAIVGWLYNDLHNQVSNVWLRVEVLDAEGQVIATGEGRLYGYVPARGRAYFSVVVPRYGTAYRISVVQFDRLQFG